MQMGREQWIDWAKRLRQLGLQGITAWLLDFAAPLRLLGAQMLYFSQPFWGSKSLSALAHLLEDDNEARAFAAFLQKEIEP
jgi:hypothetical protein